MQLIKIHLVWTSQFAHILSKLKTPFYFKSIKIVLSQFNEFVCANVITN